MNGCKLGNTLVAKGDKFSLKHYPKNDFEHKEMHKIPYASVVESLMYVQVCTRSDLAYIVGMFGRYLSNLSMDHWKAGVAAVNSVSVRGGHFALTMDRPQK